MPASDIYVRIGAKLDGLTRGIRKSEAQLKRFADFAENVGTRLTTRLSVPIVGVGTAAVRSFARFEKLQNGLVALTGDADKAAEQLARLQQIAQLPGISLEQAVKGSQALQTVGFEAKQAEAILTEFSKAVTLSGGSATELEAIVRQFTQINSKGRILQEDISVILENVPSIGIALQDAFGTTSVEAIRNSGVSAQEFTARITKAIAESEKFQGVTGGLANAFDNFGQSVQFSLATLGRSVAESINLQGLLENLAGFVSRVAEGFQNLNPGVQKFIVFTGAGVAALGPLLLGFGAAVKAVASVRSAILLLSGALQTLFLNPVGLAIAAIAALTFAFVKLYNTSAKFRAFIAGVVAVVKKFVSDAIGAITGLVDAVGAVLRGEFREAARLLRGEGKTAGETYAEAFNSSLSQSVDANISSIFEKARQRGGGGSSATNFESLFPSGFGSVPSVGGGASSVAAAIPSREAVEVVEVLRRLPVEQMRLANEVIVDMNKNVRDLGVSIVPLNEGLSATTENLLAKLEPIRAGFVAIAEEVANLATEGALSLQSFAQAAVGAIGEVIRALIQQAVSAAIANSLQFSAFLGPAAIPIAAAAGKLASGLFTNLVKNIPGLAQGGIVPPGFPNDTFPAMLSSNEAVIPLDRLDGLLGGGGQVEFIISGNVLRGILRRAESAAYRTI